MESARVAHIFAVGVEVVVVVSVDASSASVADLSIVVTPSTRVSVMIS